MSPEQQIANHRYSHPTVTEVIPHAVLKDPEDFNNSLDTPASAVPETVYPPATEILRAESNVVAFNGIHRSSTRKISHTPDANFHAA
jgi:hypothetical protein